MEKLSYYDNVGVSQSLLKGYLGSNPQVFEQEEDEGLWYTEKKHFVLGDGVDMLLTTPELFDDIMFVSELEEEQKPTGKGLGVVHLTYDKIREQGDISEESLFGNYTHCVLSAARELEWNPKWKDDTVIRNFEPYYTYFLDLLNSDGKIVLTVQEKAKIDSLVVAIRTHENTAKYFIPTDNTVIIKQMPIYWDLEDLPCKALLDMCIVDKHNKTLQPIDIKTVGKPVADFPKVMKERRYDIQAAWYTLALQEFIKNNHEYHGYTILNFKFIAASTTDNIIIPIVYTCSDDLLMIGKQGSPKIAHKTSFGNVVTLRRQIKGYEQLLQDYLCYDDIGFTTHLDVLEGDVTLDWE